MLVTPCASHKLIFSWTFAVSSCQIIIYDMASDKQIVWGEVFFNLELVDISYAIQLGTYGIYANVSFKRPY